MILWCMDWKFCKHVIGFFLAQHIHIRVKQHSYQSQLTTHVITRELSLNNYTSQKLGKETKSSRYVKSRSKRNIYRHRKWRHKVQEMVGYIGFCFSDGVSHSKWRKQKAWIFFFNLPPFGDCLIYLLCFCWQFWEVDRYFALASIWATQYLGQRLACPDGD